MQEFSQQDGQWWPCLLTVELSASWKISTEGSSPSWMYLAYAVYGWSIFVIWFDLELLLSSIVLVLACFG